MKIQAWYGPQGSLVTNEPVAGLTGPRLSITLQEYYKGTYLIGTAMTEAAAKTVCRYCGLEYMGQVKEGESSE